MLSASHAELVLLLVEDDFDVRAALAESLKNADFQVIEAADGSEALRVIEDQATVRVLITDINLPGELDGLALAHLLRARSPSLGIILVSGHARPWLHDMPIRARFLAKPFPPSTLVREITELVPRSTVD